MDLYQANHESFASRGQIGILELRRDHAVLRELLERFECTDDAHGRRDLIQLVVDLFEAHNAVEAQVRGENPVLTRECEALHALLARLERCDDAELLPLRAAQLQRAFDAYLANEEALEDASEPPRKRDLDDRGLLRERARLLDYAESLLRTH